MFVDGTLKISKYVNFKDGEPFLYKEGCREFPDGSWKIAKEYKLTHKGWQEVSE